MFDLRSLTNAHRNLKKAHGNLRYQGQPGSTGSSDTVEREEYDGWVISYQKRTIGVTVRRTQISAVLERESPKMKSYLSGFASVEAARSAARHRIDILRKKIRQTEPAYATRSS